MRDYRNAISYAVTRPEVDSERIGVWGSSYSGGHVLVVAGLDRRVRCVVSQVPFVSGYDNLRSQVPTRGIALMQAGFEADRAARYRGEPPAMFPVITENPSIPAALPGRDAYTWFSDAAQGPAPAWRNEVTLRSVEMLTEYEPKHYVPWISPTPLLMIVAEQDTVAVSSIALAAYETAGEPKSLTILSGGHFGAYSEHFATASSAAAEWFTRHLGLA